MADLGFAGIKVLRLWSTPPVCGIAMVGDACLETRILSREEVSEVTTLTDSQTKGSPEIGRLKGRIRGLTITVVVLAVALLGLGAWMIYDYATGPDTAVTGDIGTLLDDYTAAWNNYDSEAFLALVTDDYTFEGAGEVNTAEEEALGIAQLGIYDWNVTITGDRVIAGDGPTYVALQPNQVTSTAGDMEGVSVFTIVETDGSYLISGHRFVEH